MHYLRPSPRLLYAHLTRKVPRNLPRCAKLPGPEQRQNVANSQHLAEIGPKRPIFGLCSTKPHIERWRAELATMMGITVLDTHGPMLGSDQLCEAQIRGCVKVGDMVTLETEVGPTELCVCVIETHRAQDSDSVSDTFGVSLYGDAAHLVLPGDTLTHSR